LYNEWKMNQHIDYKLLKATTEINVDEVEVSSNFGVHLYILW